MRSGRWAAAYEFPCRRIRARTSLTFCPTSRFRNRRAIPSCLHPPRSAGNRADASPVADVVALLGGNPAAVTRGEVPSVDRRLVGYTERYGRRDGIRSELAAEDLEYRGNNRGRVLERLFDVNVYFRAYEHMSLDQYAELERFRAMGVRAPAHRLSQRENRTSGPGHAVWFFGLAVPGDGLKTRTGCHRGDVMAD